MIQYFKNETLNPSRTRTGTNSERVIYFRIAAAFLSATAAALWHSWSDPKNGGMCGNSGINTIKQAFKGCFSIFANLNDFITWKFRIYLNPSGESNPGELREGRKLSTSGANIHGLQT